MSIMSTLLFELSSQIKYPYYKLFIKKIKFIEDRERDKKKLNFKKIRFQFEKIKKNNRMIYYIIIMIIEFIYNKMNIEKEIDLYFYDIIK